MTNLAKVDKMIAPVNDYEYIARTLIAGVDLVPGICVTLNASTGRAGLTAAEGKPYGITLNTAKAGYPVTVLRLGTLAGYTVTGNYGTSVYVEGAAGVLGTAPGSAGVAVATVVPMTEGAGVKVLEVNCL